MPTRIFALCVVLVATQSAVAEERSLVVSRRATTAGAIVTAPPAPERSVVVASREMPVAASDKAADNDALLKQKERELARLQAEIKQLKAGKGANAQILVRIEMLEVSLTKVRRMGTDFNIPLGAAKGKAFKSHIDWLVENRAAKPLCQPNIVVASGRPGYFHVGGEVPIPRSGGDPKAAVAFQKFGTEVDLLAVATDREHVRMELRIKQSEIDNAHSVVVNGSNFPALRSRQCDTAVETKFGEPVILSGGVEERTETSKIGDKIVDQINEIALIVVATPELVEPITPPQSESNKASRK